MATATFLLHDEGQLTDRLTQLLSKTESLDIAMAWIRRGRALDMILRFAAQRSGTVRVICGVNAFLTEPEALTLLSEACNLKIAYGTAGKKLHSKLILFHSSGNTTAWVGSANLTESAFSTNRELVCEVADNGGCQKIFDEYWSEFNSADKRWLEEYANLCQLVPVKNADGLPRLEAPMRKPEPSLAWKMFVAKLRDRNADRLDWIANQLPEVSRIGLSNWQNLTKSDAEKLLGIADGYGGLGRLKGAGIVKNIFYEASYRNLKVRQQIADALNVIPLDPAAPSFEPMLERAFDLVTGLDKVHVATMTRLLTIRHPDRFVSVNGMSVAGLSELSGLTQRELHTAKGYAALIRWVMRQTWWEESDPADETSRYWVNRAALLDILAYAGDNSKGMEPYIGEDE